MVATKVLIASQHCEPSRRQTLQRHSPPLPLFPLPSLQGDFNLREGGPSIYGSLLRRYIAIYEVFPNQVNHSAVYIYTE